MLGGRGSYYKTVKSKMTVYKNSIINLITFVISMEIKHWGYEFNSFGITMI